MESHDMGSIATAVCTPLLGVAVGLALFFLIPKARAPGDKGTAITRT
jgi:hypothetical protein